MSGPRAWSLIALQPEARQYRGNTGYDDDVERIYRYDSSVANHKQLTRGDLIFIRDAERLLGVARIENIFASPADKLRQRCPVCGQVSIKFRRSRPISWRCSKGHEFEQPAAEKIAVTAYEAHYGQTFLRTPEAVPVKELKAAALRPNDQLSIEEIGLARVEVVLVSKYPAARSLIEHFLQSAALGPSEAASTADTTASFVATMTDTREKVLRSIRIRRGQKAFRDKLIRRYGPKCAASGCELMDIVEAAHIDPFRGQNDHHPENGLLLRADLHTLFDLNLMGIDPDGLVLRFPPRVKDESYCRLDGRSLLLPAHLAPAKEPIVRRWAAYLRARALEEDTCPDIKDDEKNPIGSLVE